MIRLVLNVSTFDSTSDSMKNDAKSDQQQNWILISEGILQGNLIAITKLSPSCSYFILFIRHMSCSYFPCIFDDFLKFLFCVRAEKRTGCQNSGITAPDWQGFVFLRGFGYVQSCKFHHTTLFGSNNVLFDIIFLVAILLNEVLLCFILAFP